MAHAHSITSVTLLAFIFLLLATKSTEAITVEDGYLEISDVQDLLDNVARYRKGADNSDSETMKREAEQLATKYAPIETAIKAIMASNLFERMFQMKPDDEVSAGS